MNCPSKYLLWSYKAHLYFSVNWTSLHVLVGLPGIASTFSNPMSPALTPSQVYLVVVSYITFYPGMQDRLVGTSFDHHLWETFDLLFLVHTYLFQAFPSLFLISSLQQLILYLRLTGPRGARTSGHTLFWVCPWGRFWIRLAFESVGGVNQTSLPHVSGLHPITWKLNGTKRLILPEVQGNSSCLVAFELTVFSCLWTQTETLVFSGSPACQLQYLSGPVSLENSDECKVLVTFLLNFGSALQFHTLTMYLTYTRTTIIFLGCKSF